MKILSDNFPSSPNPIRAVALLSGGIDSSIAAKVVEEQGVEIYGVNFPSPFCICNSKSHSYQCGALYFAKKMEIPINIIQRSDDYLNMVRKPKFGFGRHMNPCIDCQIYNLSKAVEFAKTIGATFFITGEVLGVKPDPQIIQTIMLIEKEAGLKGQILRPLSVTHFPPTEVEIAGIIDRNRLLQIQGQHKNVKLEPGKLIESTHLICASGGCLLSDKPFAQRLKDYFSYTSTPKMDDMKWLKIGTHYRVNNYKIIMGNNLNEFNLLEQYAQPLDLILEIQDERSPIILIQSFFNSDETIMDPVIFSENQKNVINIASQIACENANIDEKEIVTIIRRIPNLIRTYDIKIDSNFNSDSYRL